MVVKLLQILGFEFWDNEMKSKGWENIFRPPKTGHVVYGSHVPDYPKLMDLFAETGLSGISIIRDPRDAAIEVARIYGYESNEPFSDVLLRIIGQLPSRYKSRHGWNTHPNSYVTTYEKLVGSRGKGDDSLQAQEIKTICAEIGYPLTDEKLCEVQEKLYLAFPDRLGYPPGFENATVGNWKALFEERHLDLYAKMSERSKCLQEIDTMIWGG